MTYEEFLDKLRATPRDWGLIPGGGIRYARPPDYHSGAARCPVNRVFGYHSSSQIENNWQYDVLRASDWHNHADPHLVAIRREILEACGLPEEGRPPLPDEGGESG